MARRSRSFLQFTPDYGFLGQPDFFTLKILYNGTMKGTRTSKEYVGGSIEHFDFVDGNKIQMFHLLDFSEELGYKEKECFRFWHKIGDNLSDGIYLETDTDVLAIKNHIPIHCEVELYIEHVHGSATNSELVYDVNIEVEDEERGGSDDGDDDGEKDPFYDSDYDFDDRDANMYEDQMVVYQEEIPNEVLSRMQNEEGDDDCVDSDELDSNLEFDDADGESQKFPMFDPIKDTKNPELKVGMIFSSRDEAKFAIESHCIRRGMSVRFVKIDNARLRVKCRNEGCQWVVHVSPMGKDSCWQIKTFQPKHNNCFWNFRNRNVNSGWLGKTFTKKFKSNSKLGTSEFRQEICTSLKISITRKQAYLAKRKAIDIVQGAVNEQFSKIINYCAELKRVDPSATVILKLTEDNDGPRFQRMYVCFSACREGFKKACRPLIGVDGCFLKSKSGGQLLAAVGLDPNNNIFPICYALVERETKDSWMWFLQLLDSDIGFDDQYAWTFMSDKQKGLIPAFESLFPAAENRFCVRHLHSNMKSDGFRGMAVKNALWAAAKTTTIAEFRQRMDELKMIDERAYEWLAKKPVEHWSRSHFTTTPKCDVLLNNMCECFNSLILDAREKPIIPMFETIRNLLMVRFQLNREKAEKWDGKICPKIKKVLAKNYMDAAEHSPMQADHMHFQINGPSGQHTVDFGKNSCSCRKWDLTGIPCKHAVCAIWCKYQDPQDHVHPYYGIEAYRRCYEKSILPITGANLWPECELPPPLPPVYKEKVGRPAKLRRRERDEPPSSSGTHLRGVKRNNKCKKCGGNGHNQRTCKEPTNIMDEPPTQQSQSTPVVASEPIRRKKLQARKPTSQTSVKIGGDGSSNTISSLNVNHVTNILNPVFMKRGRNFVTVSKLKDCVGNKKKHSRSISFPSTHPDARASSKTQLTSRKCVGSTSAASISKT